MILVEVGFCHPHHLMMSDLGSGSKQKSVATPIISPSTIKHRRQSLANKLGEYKQEKLKRKLPVDSQLLDCAQEDIKIRGG